MEETLVKPGDNVKPGMGAVRLVERKILASFPLPAGTDAATWKAGLAVSSSSYTPPLSPSVQVTSDALVQSLVNKHQGETEVFTSCSTLGACFANCLLKLRVKNGIITSVERDDRAFFQGVGMDDAVAQTTDRQEAALISVRARDHMRYHNCSTLLTRILYPMMRASTSTRGDPNGSGVRITQRSSRADRSAETAVLQVNLRAAVRNLLPIWR